MPVLRPFRPQRRLVTILGVAFAVWVAGLIAMYVVTVWPNRYGAPARNAPATGKS